MMGNCHEGHITHNRIMGIIGIFVTYLMIINTYIHNYLFMDHFSISDLCEDNPAVCGGGNIE